MTSKSSTTSTFRVVGSRDELDNNEDVDTPLRLSKQVTFGPNEEFKATESASDDSILSWLKPAEKKREKSTEKLIKISEKTYQKLYFFFEFFIPVDDKNEPDNSSISSRESTLSWLAPNKNKNKSPKDIPPIERELSSGSDSYMKLLEQGPQSTDKLENLELSPKENSLISDGSSLISSDFDFSPPPKKI